MDFQQLAAGVHQLLVNFPELLEDGAIGQGRIQLIEVVNALQTCGYSIT